ncbi:FAD-dependent thymidylate synthase [Acidaminococcus intestini]|jgi:thymidylate synthase (FAD)|uniref:FAD-dependent thymidylate synthase n=1 Tax=Acidaminococcus intestini TaxID=187327 RepID=UPI0027BB0AF0|nr:FAD-dependent thymidylate synthase [Acidaminococcus intestini]
MGAVELVSITPNAMELLERVASVCYQKKANENVIKKILDAGHWSVFEHCYATFHIYMSVACLLQITRHRHLSFTVQSSRYTKLNECYETGDSSIDMAVGIAMESYQSMVPVWGTEKAMYGMPKAALYEVYVTGNFRAWLEYLPKRMCQRAMKEHRDVAWKIKRILEKEYPLIFKAAFPNCAGCLDKKCAMNLYFNDKGEHEHE